MTGIEDKPEGERAVVDWSVALVSTGGDTKLLRDLLAEFLDTEGPKLQDSIRTSIEELDPELLRRMAHTMKGNMRIFGARRTENWAEQLEQLGGEQLRAVGRYLHENGIATADDTKPSSLEAHGKKEFAQMSQEDLPALLSESQAKARELSDQLSRALEPVLEEMRSYLQKS